jgi:hypothetical protein
VPCLSACPCRPAPCHCVALQQEQAPAHLSSGERGKAREQSQVCGRGLTRARAPVTQCEPEICRQMEARYGRKDYVEERVTFRHRFLMVVDGNSFSTRRARHISSYARPRSMSAAWRPSCSGARPCIRSRLQRRGRHLQSGLCAYLLAEGGLMRAAYLTAACKLLFSFSECESILSACGPGCCGRCRLGRWPSAATCSRSGTRTASSPLCTTCRYAPRACLCNGGLTPGRVLVVMFTALRDVMALPAPRSPLL